MENFLKKERIEDEFEQEYVKQKAITIFCRFMSPFPTYSCWNNEGCGYLCK